MTDIHGSFASVGMCDCREFCIRWQWNENTDTGFFCPYIPGEEIYTNQCKALKNNIFNMKQTIVKKESK